MKCTNYQLDIESLNQLHLYQLQHYSDGHITMGHLKLNKASEYFHSGCVTDQQVPGGFVSPSSTSYLCHQLF